MQRKIINFQKKIQKILGLIKKLGEDILTFNEHKFFEGESSVSPLKSPSNIDTAHREKSTQFATIVSISIKNNYFWIHNSNKKFLNYLVSMGHHSMKSLNDSPTANFNHQKTQTHLLDNAGYYKQIIENGPWIVVRYFNENQVIFLYFSFVF